MKTLIKLSFVVFAFTALTFVSCNKEGELNSDSTEQALIQAQENSLADNAFEDIENIGDVANNEQETLGKTGEHNRYFGDCAEITRVFSDGVYTMTIDFGDGCEGAKGNIRKGKIIVKHTAHFWAMKSKITYTFEDFYFNDNKIEGVKVVERMAFNSENGNPSSKITVDGKIIEV